ncbi:hypothetical protein [Halostreptopolyspora alba]|uniref:Adhesin domain-containing protein n=1 Tax=Halostreptopolyspora alba TaxID=2487137 RepID=A0A3N0DYZ4_9ACTN|nr:hypothetical protein EFW17_22475 [Nocardiopsaceae bacterium YIM 96095]
MPTTTLSAPTEGPLTAEITADQLELEVVVEPGRTRAELELTGPETTLDATRSEMNGCWRVEVPSPACEPAVVAGGGIQAAQVSGATVVIGGSNSGAISVGAGGSVRVNGVTITTGETSESVRARLRLPEGCGLRTDITNGQVAAHAHLVAVDHRGHNAGLDLASADEVEADVHNGSVAIGRARGDVQIGTHNGAVRVQATGARTNVRTHNGPVAITAGSDGPISASTHNGPITVHRAGFDARVRTRTHNGTETVR